MALSIDQTTSTFVDNNVSSSSHSFGTLPAAGSTVIVLLSVFNGTASDTHALGTGGVTDNQAGGGNTYTLAKELIHSDNQGWAAVYVAKNVASAGTFTITLTGRASSFFTWAAESVKGWAGTSTIKATNGADSSTSTLDPGSVTTVNNDAVVVGVNSCSSQVSTGFTGSPPTGFTQLWQDTTGGDQNGEADYKIRTTTGTEHPTWTTTGQSTPGGVSVVASIEDVLSSAKKPIAAYLQNRPVIGVGIF